MLSSNFIYVILFIILICYIF